MICQWHTAARLPHYHTQGQYLGMGTDRGDVLLWDMAASTQVSTPLGTHRERVGALAWKDDLLCSGSRDRTIVQWDPRSSTRVQEYKSHTQVGHNWHALICTNMYVPMNGCKAVFWCSDEHCGACSQL